MIADITQLNQRIRDLDHTISHLVTPLAPTLLQITGISYNSATVLSAETGDITRVSNPAKRASCTGCTPIPV